MPLDALTQTRDERKAYLAGARVGKRFAKEKEEREKKISGMGFWVIVFLALIKDAADALLTASVYLSVVSTILSVFVVCIVTFYFYYNDVALMSTRKLATYLIAVVVELIPFLAAFPAFTMMVIAVRLIENNEALRKVAEAKRSARFSNT